MTTPNDSTPPAAAGTTVETYSATTFDSTRAPLPLIDPAGDSIMGTEPVVISPDDPPWSLPGALGVLFGSLVLLVLVPVIAVIPYIIWSIIWLRPGPQVIAETLQTDKNVILIAILANLPVHFLTIALCWMLVTKFGKHPFWRTLGWSWSPRVGLGTSIGLGVGLFLLGVGISQIFTEQETQLSRIINTSQAVRYAVVAMATLTAPLAEELVYRGVLYSALQRTLATVWGVVGVMPALQRTLGTVCGVTGVMLVFALIHVPQYYPSWGAISTIVVLSLALTLVRAYSGRLLPSVVIHTVFNGISSVFILLEPHLKSLAPVPDQPTATTLLLFPFASRLAHLFLSIL